MQTTILSDIDEHDLQQRHGGEDRANAEQGRCMSVLDAKRQDAYWERAYREERYFNPALDYEDYAPAYCVGYIGYVQYGGEFDEAEKSLCANWERIKGDSRLSLEEALQAIRAAWQQMAGVH
jgi:hypothetical protein